MPAKPLRFDPIAEARRQWQARWGRAPGPSMAAVTSIMRSQQILLGRLNEALKPLGLTFARYEALMLLYLSRRGALPLGKVGERLQVHRTSVTNLIDGLEASGLARRVAHEHDRRTTLAQITPRGRRVAERATELLNGREFELQGLRRAEMETLTGLLERVRRAAGDWE